LAAEEEIDVQEGEIYLSNVSLLESMGIGVWAALFILLFFVMISVFIVCLPPHHCGQPAPRCKTQFRVLLFV